jgi:hypothetical protein
MSHCFGIPSTIGTIVEGDAWRSQFNRGDNGTGRNVPKPKRVQHLRPKKHHLYGGHNGTSQACQCGQDHDGFIVVDGSDDNQPEDAIGFGETDEGTRYHQIRDLLTPHRGTVLNYCPEPEFAGTRRL